jgi:chromosome segregation ATPase
VAESVKSIATKAAAAAVERTLKVAMPELYKRLDRIDDRTSGLSELHKRLERIDERIGGLDRELFGVRELVESRFEQLRDAVNELGQRMARVEGRLEEVVRGMEQQGERLNRQSDKMDQWIERLVRLEMTRGPRRGKRAS